MSPPEGNIQVKYVLSHPIQYFAPLMRKISDAAGIDLKVIYGIDAGAESYFDPGFGRTIRWDQPLLEGYASEILGPGQTFGEGFSFVTSTGLHRHLRRNTTDIVISHGWATALSIKALVLSKAQRIPLLLRGESQRHSHKRGWAQLLKSAMLHPLLKRVEGILAIGTLNKEFYVDLGIPTNRIFWTPYSIDTDGFLKNAVTDEQLREEERTLGLTPGSFRVIACGKLAAYKRPQDVITSVSRMKHRGKTELLFVGDGPMRQELEKKAAQAEVKTHFLGFRNQNALPLAYRLADVMVLASEHEPWGLVVNEAMTMGLPTIVTEVVGSGPDLVVNDKTGFIVKVGDTGAIAAGLDHMAGQPESLRKMKAAALEQVAAFHLDRTAEGYLDAIRTTADNARRAARAR
ncbi:glycosyltransferase family 4 protein [bacterium AH-315-F18]|nr:glycosyltransferase family 4 protein [bacterium AH-315-F18]